MSEHRRLPHLQSFERHPIVFLTVVTAGRRACLTHATAHQILVSVWQNSPQLDGWFVGDYLVMPDHVHLFARPARDTKSLADWNETWKSLSSRQLKRTLQLPPPFWQADYFDRFLRSAESYTEKWNYVALNPVRAGLCQRPEDWPWRGRLHDLYF